ncbi:MAG: prenyltransferase/squalene oxidase repeat-containing protein [Planctomycetota bacterium]
MPPSCWPVVTRKSDSTVPSAPHGLAPPRPMPPVVVRPPVARPVASKQPQEIDPSSAVELPSVRDHEAESDDGTSLLSRLSTIRLSSWLFSVSLHLALLILLAVLTYRLADTKEVLSIEGSRGDRKTVTLEILPQTKQLAASDGVSTDRPLKIEIDLPLEARDANDARANLEARPVDPSILKELLSGGSPTNQYRSILGGGGMSARTPEGRRTIGVAHGATRESEEAVERALRWLASHQRNDGSWSFDLRLAPCEGRCRHGKPAGESTATPATAATGLALLAFLGAGHTPERGEYRETVSRGLYYLRAVAVEAEFGYDWQQGGSMYGHGIAMMALAEALGMTKHQDRFDSDLLHHVERGALFTSAAQHANGSWGYTPGRPGDTTLTGWQLLSLVGARRAGIRMRSDIFRRTRAFLMSVRDEPSYDFGYNSPRAEPTTTAIGLTLMMYLGQTPGNTSFDRSVDRMAERGPTLTNVYHDYYATLALHHWQHPQWETWNQKLRDHLVRTQETKGHEAGSWHFKDEHGDIGGRLYTTTMATLILEVYYRFLPLYEMPSEFPL